MDRHTHIPTDLEAYNNYVECMRNTEYPMLNNSIYLDHAGTTLYSKSLMERFQADMMANLYGNPHSASSSSQRSTQEIESVRLDLLQFFNADPDCFDLVFTANATAGIKLVGEAFREQERGFAYGYHVDSHTSLVGLREFARAHVCVESDEVERILEFDAGEERSTLFAYPLQSNMNGRRLPLEWSHQVKEANTSKTIYTLMDAAAYVSTSRLDLSDVDAAPDYTVLSLYKIFGFPDLGALIIKKDAAHVFSNRRYFGGGTVDMVACLKEQWHAKKIGSLHEQLEEGTVPVHSIIALRSALRAHQELFGSLEQISNHTAALAKQLYGGLLSLKHSNNLPVCSVYKHPNSIYGEVKTQGPTVAFNLRDSNGNWVSNAEIEKLALMKNIHLRTGGVCNPGGIATALSLAPWEMRENFSTGHRCGSENDILNGKPTGVIRVSLGAMSTRSDVERFLEFIDEFFVSKTSQEPEPTASPVVTTDRRFHVESLTVYPIKSCGGWQIPHGRSWEVHGEGLAWDREWCIVHQGTGNALSQKQFPRMALLRPNLDFKAGQLRVNIVGSADEISIPLSKNPNLVASNVREYRASVCEAEIKAFIYKSSAIAGFFTKAIGTACTLARFHPTARRRNPRIGRSILLSNESPILTISRSSLNRLNEQIKARGGKAALPSVFRPNIVLAESPLLAPGHEQPWAEDCWHHMRIGGSDGALFDFLGGCKRCQMVCVDQESAEKNGEPFVTLAKTRRYNGRVLFGVHTALAFPMERSWSIKAGDAAETWSGEDEMANLGV